jgi:hypothetical protein
MHYKLLNRNDKAAIYEQFTAEGLHVGYEVFIVKIQQAFKFPNGVENPACEAFPSNESFGHWAWTYMAPEIKDAEKRYEEITQGILKPIVEKVEKEVPVSKKGIKRLRGRPAKNPGAPKVIKAPRAPRGKFTWEGTEYSSKSEVAIMLFGKGDSKKTIASKLQITVQTVHAAITKRK